MFSSFRAAFRGLARTWITQRNFRFEVIVGVVTMALAFFLRVSYGEWLILIAVITAMLVLELINTTVEFVADLLRPRLHDAVRVMKDVASAAVLVGAFGAAVVGLMVFLPHVLRVIGNQ